MKKYSYQLQLKSNKLLQEKSQKTKSSICEKILETVKYIEHNNDPILGASKVSRSKLCSLKNGSNIVSEKMIAAEETYFLKRI